MPKTTKTPTKKAPAAKKIAAPAAKKRAVSETPKKARKPFALLEKTGEELIDASLEALQKMQERRKNRHGQFMILADQVATTAYLDHFLFQFLFGMKSLRRHGLIDVVGQQGVGKTSLAFFIAGMYIRQFGSPVLYLESESKQMDNDQIKRMLSPDADVAQTMLERIIVRPARTLMEYEEALVDFVTVHRGGSGGKKALTPDNVPLFVIVDSWSKLMERAEAMGFYDYDDLQTPTSKAKEKTAEEFANFGHAKWAQNFSRRLPAIIDLGVLHLVINHQNDSVSMSSGPRSFTLSPEQLAPTNVTKRGGRAYNQMAMLQFTMTQKGLAKGDGKNITGSVVRYRVTKNSFGPQHRHIEVELRNENYRDTHCFLDPAWRFDEALCKLLEANRVLGIKEAGQGQYSCQALTGTDMVLTSQQLVQLLHASADALQAAGHALRVKGYDFLIDESGEAIEQAEINTEPDSDFAEADLPSE